MGAYYIWLLYYCLTPNIDIEITSVPYNDPTKHEQQVWPRKVNFDTQLFEVSLATNAANRVNLLTLPKVISEEFYGWIKEEYEKLNSIPTQYTNSEVKTEEAIFYDICKYDRVVTNFNMLEPLGTTYARERKNYVRFVN